MVNVGTAGCFIAGVHGKLGQTNVSSVHGGVGIGNIAKGRTAAYVGTVRKMLNGNPVPVTDIFKDGTGETVGGVFLICAVFDDNALIHIDTVLLVVFFGMIRMYRMSIVSGEHEASR